MSSSTLPPPPIRWGILGAANIAVRQVIPATQQSLHSEVVAIASRSIDKARAAAEATGVPRAYGSYDELIADPDIDAIYNPLPNHLHVPWTIRAAQAGKHVLCEKPIALNAAEARKLIAVRNRMGVQIAEAFMVRTHPRWAAVRELAHSGRIGALRLIAGHFSYYRRDPDDVRSKLEWGGGALLDIGCYPIMLSRWMFGAEPQEVIGIVDRDPDMQVDRLASVLLRFPSGQATFSCAGQLVPWQRMQLFGTTGRIDVEIPFNAPADYRARIFLDDGGDLRGAHVDTIDFPAVNQYTLQADRFVDAIRGMGAVPVSIEDAVANMSVLDAIFRSEQSGRWEQPSAQ